MRALLVDLDVLMQDTSFDADYIVQPIFIGSVTRLASGKPLFILTYTVKLLFRLPSLLVNRLVLNLKTFDTSQPGDTSDTEHLHSSEPVFAQNRFLGNIGAPLDHSQWDTDEGDHGELVEESFEGAEDSDREKRTGPKDQGSTLVPVVSLRIILWCCSAACLKFSSKT